MMLGISGLNNIINNLILKIMMWTYVGVIIFTLWLSVIVGATAFAYFEINFSK